MIVTVKSVTRRTWKWNTLPDCRVGNMCYYITREINLDLSCSFIRIVCKVSKQSWQSVCGLGQEATCVTCSRRGVREWHPIHSSAASMLITTNFIIESTVRYLIALRCNVSVTQTAVGRINNSAFNYSNCGSHCSLLIAKLSNSSICEYAIRVQWIKPY